MLFVFLFTRLEDRHGDRQNWRSSTVL